MKVICFEDEAFHKLIEVVVSRMVPEPKQDKYVSPKEAMRLLNITSSTTLQKLRDTGVIVFSQPTKKRVLYDYDSIIEYLDSHRCEKF